MNVWETAADAELGRARRCHGIPASTRLRAFVLTVPCPEALSYPPISLPLAAVLRHSSLSLSAAS